MTIFISKAESELEEIPHYLNSQNIKGVFESLIRFEPLSFQINSPFEVIFFPSIRSAKFVLDSGQIDLSACILACNGSQTQKRLLDLGYSCDYIAENAGDPDRVAKDFSQWLGQKKVLIPHSNLSALSVTKYLNPNQYSTIEVYKTVDFSMLIEPCDIYVFSSPSNIDSFFKQNAIKAGSTIIVWGNTSLNCLQKYGHQADYKLEEGTMVELFKVLQKNINK